ncbi:MAG: hypothetical protein NTW26_04525 [bacterium]|nr:hypothetical protein [bacterium]
MRKYLIATLAILVLAGVGMAKEYVLEAGSVPGSGATLQYEPVSPMPSALQFLPPVPPSVTEFEYDSDGSGGSYCNWASYGIRIGKWFNGSDWGITEGYITGYRINYYMYSGGTDNCHASFYDWTGGYPDTGTLLWETDFSPSGSSGFVWYDMEVDPPIYDADANFDSLFVWNDTSATGGPSVDFDGPFDHDYQDYYGWGSGWYNYLLRAYFNDDVDAPYSANQDPAPDAVDVPIGTNITFDIVDDDYGTDGDTILVEVDSVDVTADCTITDNGDGSFSILYDPAVDFDYSTSVVVYWSAADGLGNLGEDTWSFDTEEEPPSVVSTTWGLIKTEF